MGGRRGAVRAQPPAVVPEQRGLFLYARERQSEVVFVGVVHPQGGRRHDTAQVLLDRLVIQDGALDPVEAVLNLLARRLRISSLSGSRFSK